MPQITLDLLVHVLQQSVLSPFVASLVPVAYIALGFPSHAPQIRQAVYYACFVIFLRICLIVDRRIARQVYKPRRLKWEDEVVVITGGASGLGRLIAEVYAMRGVSVAVLDIQKPKEVPTSSSGRASGPLVSVDEDAEDSPIRFYECDIGDRDAVHSVKDQIERDLGTPTILINNAGMVNSKPILSLTTTDLRTNFNVNLLAHYHTLQAFLPGMLRRPDGGTIVTVASVLGKLGCAGLSDYSAAKAGLIALHRSLQGELALMSSDTPDRSPLSTTNSSTANGTSDSDNSRSSAALLYPRAIRTVLVTPGQLSTTLFRHVTPPALSSFTGPVVEPAQLCTAIVKAVDAGTDAEVSLPLYARWVLALDLLPWGCREALRRASGLDLAGWGATAEGKAQARETRSAVKR